MTARQQKPDPRLVETLNSLVTTDAQLAETMKTIGVIVVGLALRVEALESASEAQRNLLAGAVDMVNLMRGVIEIFGGGIATLERRVVALEQVAVAPAGRGAQLHKMGFQS